MKINKSTKTVRAFMGEDCRHGLREALGLWLEVLK